MNSLKIIIEDASPNQVITKPVTLDGENIIFKEGTQLTESIISSLKTLGITSITIDRTSYPSTLTDQRVDEIFSQTTSPTANKIKDTLKDHIKKCT